MKLLLVEDDLALQTSLVRALTRLGWAVEVCADGANAVAHWRQCVPDVVLLDLSLPGLDGLQVLAQARQSGLSTPVLILTARGTVGDRVQGLNAGADDYLPKPFDLDELEARVRALHRRQPEAQGASAVNTSAGAAPRSANHGGLRYDKDSGAIYHQNQVLELTPRELALLKALLVRPGHAVSKERLFELVFPGQDQVQYEAIEVVVYRLRKKLSPTGTTLMTLRGLGYLLKVPAP
jgi:two-component system response regulator TctD